MQVEEHRKHRNARSQGTNGQGIEQVLPGHSADEVFDIVY